jgi:hypothetical protein
METTAWMKLYAARHDHALITVTGLDYDSFAKLLALFGLYYNDFTIGGAAVSFIVIGAWLVGGDKGSLKSAMLK